MVTHEWLENALSLINMPRVYKVEKTYCFSGGIEVWYGDKWPCDHLFLAVPRNGSLDEHEAVIMEAVKERRT